MSTIQKGHHVMLVNNSTKEFKCVQVPRRQHVYIKPLSFSPNKLIGYLYGSKFNVVKGELEPAKLVNSKALVSENCNKTNEFIMDNIKSQQLSQSDIISMKDKGVKGEDIVDTLVQNSTSFNEKTEFSKAKWMKKKLTKHLPVVVACKPSIRRIASSATSKIRPDVLSSLLNSANVWNGSKVIVLECRDDLLTSAVAEQIHDKGSVVQIYEQRLPHVLFCNWLNFSMTQKNMIKYYPLKFLSFMDTVSDKDNKFDELVSESSKYSQENCHPGKRKRPEEDHDMEHLKSIASDLCCGDYDSLIISTSYDPFPALEVLYKYIKTSGKIIIHTDNMAVVLECVNFLNKHGGAEVSIVDHWFREIQVLPGRTHPDMRMQGGGGFILTATKIHPGVFQHGSNLPVTEEEVAEREKEGAIEIESL